MTADDESSMTRWAFVIGPGRSGTTLLGNLLNRSSQIYIAHETKYFQQVWSQRHLLRFVPRRRRIPLVVDHVISSEYPADPPTFRSHRDEFITALRDVESLEAGFLALLRTLSDRPVLGEKTPWHTFFVEQIDRVASDARFVAITRDAPATVASTLGREGFRRVDSLTRCIARWIFMNRELLRVREALPDDRLQLVRFEDLVREPEAVLGEVCAFLDVALEPPMLQPTSQDSSLREEDSGGGFDTGALHRWRETLTGDQVRRIRSHTWRTSRALGYAVDPVDAGLADRIAVNGELAILAAGIHLMRSGFYPFGPAARLVSDSGPEG